MAVVPALGDPPPSRAIDEAAAALAGGLPVGVPTDTVYGLAVDPTRRGATDRLFAAKRRPREANIPVLVSGVDQALSLTTALPPSAVTLMRAYWPGALTVVVASHPDLRFELGEDQATIGVRCPAHPVPVALCERVGPLATTSANLHAEPTLVTAADVARVFGDAVPVVLDGGRCEGSPSTVVDCTGEEPRLLREGRLPWEEVRAALA